MSSPQPAPETPHCRVCHSTRIAKHFWPQTEFNGRFYTYYRCANCGSLSMFPMPDDAALAIMYGHLYDAGGLPTQPVDPATVTFNLYDHQRIALRFFRQAIGRFPLKGRMLDYGCGNGFYMVEAYKAGLQPEGVEFNADVARRVTARTGLTVEDVDSFWARLPHLKPEERYDILHLSHLLEHVDDPLGLMQQLLAAVKPGGWVIVDGPVENNGNLARYTVDFISRLQGRAVNHGLEPMHVTFTTARGQQAFFRQLGLQQQAFGLAEQAYPLPKPSMLNWRSPRSVVTVGLAQLSLSLSKLVPGWGNVFHYVGRNTH